MKNRIRANANSFFRSSPSSSLNEWSPAIQKVYLDGNNMLFVESAIRRLCLNHKRRQAEKAIAALARYFLVKKGVEVVLVFDQTKLSVKEELRNGSGWPLKFEVLSARPQFESSDDALVVWAEKEAGGLAKTLIVTSDVGLMKRLVEKGATMLMKSGRFFKEAEAVLGAELKAQILERDYS